MNSKTALQVKLTKEYSNKHYFDKMKSQIGAALKLNNLFVRYQSIKLFTWQCNGLKLIMQQSSCEILWIVYIEGNTGKTTFGLYLCAMFGFKMRWYSDKRPCSNPERRKRFFFYSTEKREIF